MEDARSLAGLAMEVYSDRISIDQDEQERLRFSPDDIVRLPIHRAINLWVADGVPRAGFLAHTLPMEQLHDAASPADTTPARSANAAATTPTTSPTRSPALDARARAGHRRARGAPRTPTARRPRAATQNATARNGNGAALQLPLDDATRPTHARRSRRRRVLAPSYLEAHRYDGAVVAARPPRPTSCRARSSRATSRSSATCWRYKFLTAPQLLELWWPSGAAWPGQRRLRKLFRRRLPRALPAARPPRLVPLDLPPRRRRPPTAPARRRSSTARSATTRARSTTTATSSTRSSSTPGCSPPAAPPDDALLAWHGETRHRRHRRRPATRSCASTTTGQPRTYATHAPRLVRPDAVLEIAARQRDRPPAVPRRVRPHPARRQELRQVPPLRHLPVLVVAPQPSRRPAQGPVRAVRLPDPRPTRAVPRGRRPRTHRPPLAPGDESHEYVGRQRMLFALEHDAHAGVLEAWQLPDIPPAIHTRTGGPSRHAPPARPTAALSRSVRSTPRAHTLARGGQDAQVASHGERPLSGAAT